MTRLFFIFMLWLSLVSASCLQAQRVYPHQLWGSWEEITTAAQAASDLQSIVSFQKDGIYRLQVGDIVGEGKWRLIRRKQRIKVKRFHYIGTNNQNQEPPYDFELGVQMPNDSTLVLTRKRHGKTYQATYRRCRSATID